jgi:hypothetical protein
MDNAEAIQPSAIFDVQSHFTLLFGIILPFHYGVVQLPRTPVSCGGN